MSCKPDGTVFQFHYGSIKIGATPTVNSMIQKFQFHYGSIKIRDGFGSISEFQMFQFHYGSIKMTEPRSLQRNGAKVSIPLWFD